MMLENALKTYIPFLRGGHLFDLHKVINNSLRLISAVTSQACIQPCTRGGAMGYSWVFIWVLPKFALNQNKWGGGSELLQ